MGQKVHPTGLRLGIIRTWSSQWYAEGKYAEWLHEDIKIRKYIHKKLEAAGISKVEIERAANKVKVNICTSRPGIVIGRKGKDVDNLRAELTKMCGGEVFLNIHEIRKAETDAMLVAQGIATQLERRVAFRRAMKRALQMAEKFGAKGIKIKVGGRLGGAEMARTEQYRKGRVPLHTLRADIDYGFWEAKTQYGIIGIKVWIFKGEVIDAESRERSMRPRGPATPASN
jgi:small subunit ribosomal protein S3